MRIAIAHASWLPERVATLQRLLADLPDATVIASRRPEHASVWSHRTWEWAEEQDDDVCILNDDVFVCPDFPRVIEAMAEAAEGKVLSLHTSVPQAVTVTGRWLRCYWLTGPGFVLPKGVPAKLLDYAARLPWSWVSRYNEDNLAIQWAWENQEPFWSSVPAVVRHDTKTRSSLGYDGHALRTSCVDWEDFKGDMTDPAYWREGVDSPPFVENPWAKTPWLEQVRRGLNVPTVCQACWVRPGLASRGSVILCGQCIHETVGMVLNNARKS